MVQEKWILYSARRLHMALGNLQVAAMAASVSYRLVHRFPSANLNGKRKKKRNDGRVRRLHIVYAGPGLSQV